LTPPLLKKIVNI